MLRLHMLCGGRHCALVVGWGALAAAQQQDVVW